MKQLLNKYREYLASLGARPETIYTGQPDGYALGGPRAIDNHVLYMVADMQGQLERANGHADAKFQRWLGFIQGVMWLTGMYSLDQLRDQTREAVHEQQRADVTAGRILD